MIEYTKDALCELESSQSSQLNMLEPPLYQSLASLLKICFVIPEKIDEQ